MARALGGDDPRRRLELGVGEGRLTPAMLHGAEEYIGIDLHPEFLSVAAGATGSPHRTRFIAANLNHIPLAGASVTSVASFRVFNFLDDPGVALREISRVLVPGGRLLLTLHPHPSLSSLVDDLKVGLSGNAPPGFRPRTFRRTSPVPVEPAAFPTWSWRRPDWRRLLREEGWLPDGEFSTGLEDFRWVRRVPAAAFVGLAQLPTTFGVRPTWFSRWRRSGTRSPQELPSLDLSLSCPECGRAIDGAKIELRACPGCGLAISTAPPVLDLRFPRPADGAGSRDPRGSSSP